MAVSLLSGQNDMDINTTAIKSLAVRTNSVVSIASERRQRVEKGPELAEQLNEETKQKYVKGRYLEPCYPHLFFLIASRQKAWRRNICNCLSRPSQIRCQFTCCY